MDFQLNKEQQDIIQAAREFAEKEFTDLAHDYDRNETFDFALRKKACELGFVGVHVDETYDGAGYGFLEHCLITEEFFSVDPGIASAVLSTTSSAVLIELCGSEDQKKELLPQLVSGEALVATAIGEKDFGLDVTRVTTAALKDGQGWVINGSKSFVQSGDAARYLLVLAVTDPDKPSERERHSIILVPASTPGVTVSRLRGKLGLRAGVMADLSFSDVRVPLSSLLGREGGGIPQWDAVCERVDPMFAAMGVGIARAALEESAYYAKRREAFGIPLSTFESIQSKLVEMATMIRGARSLYYEAAGSVDNGTIDNPLIAMSKRHAGQVAVSCADEALQIHGGYGYMDEYKVQRLYRDAKVVQILGERTKRSERLTILRSVLR
jgi:alkylation response protein AidB-like acyl-CoA dehydrogenase